MHGRRSTKPAGAASEGAAGAGAKIVSHWKKLEEFIRAAVNQGKPAFPLVLVFYPHLLHSLDFPFIALNLLYASIINPDSIEFD
jgi:hypothetical protein